VRPSGSPQLSGLLRDMAMRAKGDISLNDLLNAFGERSFGAALLILAAPNVVPGVAAILGLPLIFITAQLMLGWKTVWLPHRFLNYTLHAESFKKVADALAPRLERVEKLLKPRGTLFTSAFGERLAGLACLVMSVILFLPIAGFNLLPTLTLCAFALGLIEQDAHAMAAGWLLAAVTVALLFFFGGLAFAAAFAFFHWW
jgi:hypothetical protein